MHIHQQSVSKKRGFTLIELSIVIVIIGLIVGSVLVGADLIQAAKVRGTITQMEKLKTAVTTFRLKFNAIPGDMIRTEALAFGLTVLTSWGDGNGLVSGPGGSALPEGEILLIWRQLAEANLFENPVGLGLRSGTGYTQSSTNSPDKYLAAAKIRDNIFFVVYSVSGINYVQLVPLTEINDTPAWVYSNTGITPVDSYNIDIKVDDGMPRTGSVIARLRTVSVAPSVAATSTSNFCVIGTNSATDTYNRVAATGGNDPSCSIQTPIQ